jgi:hypothetical protein
VLADAIRIKFGGDGLAEAVDNYERYVKSYLPERAGAAV